MNPPRDPDAVDQTLLPKAPAQAPAKTVPARGDADAQARPADPEVTVELLSDASAPARVAAGVSLLIAGAVAALGIAWAVNEGERVARKERDNVVEEQRKTAAALEQVTREQGRTRAILVEVASEQVKTAEQLRQAVAARNVAHERYEKAVAAYNVLVTDIDRKMSDRAGLQDLRKTLLLNATDGLKQLVASGGDGGIATDRTLVAAHRQMGEVYQLVGETAKARESHLKAVELAALVQMAAAPADKRAASRDLGRSLEKLAGIHLQAGDTKSAIDAIDNAVKVFEKLAEGNSDAEAQKDLASAKALRAKVLADRGETHKALLESKAAFRLRQDLSRAAPNDLELKRDLAAGLDTLAGLYLRTGFTEDALGCVANCLRVRKELANQLPDRTDVQRELAGACARVGEVHFERAQMKPAAGAYEWGVDILKRLAEEDPKSAGVKAELAAMYGRLGRVQIRAGDVEEAVANTKAGKELAAELQMADPDSALARGGLALARERYGDALLVAGRTEEGVKEYEASEKLLRALRKGDGQSVRAKVELARGLERLGDGFMAKRNMAGAVAAYGESVEIRKKVEEEDKASAAAKREHALALYKLADAHCLSGKPGVGAKLAAPATETLVALAAADPASVQFQRDVAVGYGKWGQILLSDGHATGALLVWQSSLDRCEKLAKLDVFNVQAKEDEAAAWERLAGLYAARGHRDRALAAARTAVEKWEAITKDGDVKTKAGRRRLALAMLRVGDIGVGAGQLGGAREWFEKAAKEAECAGADLLLSPVAELIAKQRLYLDAVEAGLKNPMDVAKFPVGVRAAALRTVGTLELRADHPVNASAAAMNLMKIAATPEDKFAVAAIFAGSAASERVTADARRGYADDAVKQLKVAIDAGFRDAEPLAEPEWEAVRRLAPEFAKVREELEKKVEGEGK